MLNLYVNSDRLPLLKHMITRTTALLAAMTVASVCVTCPLAAQTTPAKTDSTARDTTSQRSQGDTVLEADEYPVPLQKVPPVYPLTAQMRNITGKVIVKVLISKEGEPMMASVYKSDAKELEEPAVNAVMKWKFKPAMLKGVPVEFWVMIPFQFNFKK